MPKLAIYCRINGQDELLGVREFDVSPRAGEDLLMDRHGEELALHIERVEHRITDQGHVPKLMCVPGAGRD